MSVRPFRDIRRRKTKVINVGDVKIGGDNPISVQSMTNTLTSNVKATINQINDIEVLGPVDSPLLKIKKNFRSRLLIRFDNRFLMQKKISNVLNGLKISSKIKLMVDVDPINFA